MMLENLQSELPPVILNKKNLEFFILSYTLQNQNVPFNCKTISYALKGLNYQKNYIAITLSKLVRFKYISEPELGVYVMTNEAFQVIKNTNPVLAQEIKSNMKCDNVRNWQKSIC